MLQHVYERACQARYLTSTVIATDDDRISAVARQFGARVRMTRRDHASGTDRVAEVASAETADLVVNIQADEPLIDPAAIDAAILPLVHDPDIQMGTLKKRIEDPREITDPNVVKVVTDCTGNAIYFSRCPIPYVRPESGRGPGPHEVIHYKHIGLYVYRRDFLLGYSALPVGPLEQAERLNLFTLVHEIAHQLSFNTGLFQRTRVPPLCLSEGLATYVELWQPDVKNAIGGVNRPRLQALPRLSPFPALLCRARSSRRLRTPWAGLAPRPRPPACRSSSGPCPACRCQESSSPWQARRGR